MRLWEVSTGKYINSLTGHPSSVNAVAFSPDGKILASAGSTLRLWDANTGELLHANSKDLGSINLLAFSPDGKILATGGGWDHTVHLWDVHTGTLRDRSQRSHRQKFVTWRFRQTAVHTHHRESRQDDATLGCQHRHRTEKPSRP